jgi:hypothetical protein
MKTFKDVWEDAANSVGAGGVSMPSDAVHDKKKKKKNIYDGRTKAGRKFVERILNRRKTAESKKEVKENVNSDVKKVMPSLEKALKKERIKSLRDIERFFDYDGGDIIFDKIKNQDKANMAIHHAKELLIKKYKLKEEITEAYKFSKNDFRYWRSGGMELKLRNGAHGYDVEKAFKQAGYDVNGKDLDIRRDSIRFNSYSKHWGTDDKKIRKVVLKVLGVDIERL